MNIKIVTWNIAGARRIKSLTRWDYQDEELDYFVTQLKALSPDIICLQESHSNSSRSQAVEIAKKIGFNFFVDCPMSEARIDPQYQTTISIISNTTISDIEAKKLDYPEFKLVFPDGKEARKYDKYYLSTIIRGIRVVNIQVQPLHIWGHSYEASPGYELAQKYQQYFLNFTEPLILCGDLNTNQPDQIYSEFFNKFKLQEALPNKITRPDQGNKSRKSDHIFYSSNMSKINSDVIATDTDHYLCYSIFQIPNQA